jgi:uncharacterized protein (TIGR03000 family)
MPARSYQSSYGYSSLPARSADYRSPYAIVGYADGSKARIQVRVPDSDAEVWFEGAKRTDTGTVRTYTTPSLTPGAKYAYTIRARWREGDRTVERTTDVYFKAGQEAVVDFRR